MTRAEKVAWSAGFIDGEGCILITNNVSGSGRKRRKCLRLTVSQKDRRPLEFLQEIWGGTIAINRRGEEFRLWQWNVSTKAAAEVLEEVAPMLIGKKDQALLAIEFQRRRNRTSVHRTEDQHAWDSWAREELSKMKRRLPDQTPEPFVPDLMESLW